MNLVTYLHLVEPPLKQKAKAKNLSFTGLAAVLTSLNLKKIADAEDFAGVLKPEYSGVFLKLEKFNSLSSANSVTNALATSLETSIHTNFGKHRKGQ
jgi:hypothetical protein